MKIPNGHNAQIDKNKILNYILSQTHISGRGKAKFFRDIGYKDENAEQLINVLKEIISRNQIIKTESTKFEDKFIIDGLINAPNKKEYLVRTIWIIEINKNPVFVTAYPL